MSRKCVCGRWFVFQEKKCPKCGLSSDEIKNASKNRQSQLGQVLQPPAENGDTRHGNNNRGRNDSGGEAPNHIQSQVNALLAKNEQLANECDKLRERLQEASPTSPFDEEREALLAETTKLLQETEKLRGANCKIMQNSNSGYITNQDYEGNRCGDAGAERFREEISKLRRHVEALTSENEKLKENQASPEDTEALNQAKSEIASLKKSLQTIELEKAQLAAKADSAMKLQDKIAELEKTLAEMPSDNRLRMAMTTGATTDQLKQAIQGTMAVVDEAQRELERRQLRARRAAYEDLHKAMEKSDESALITALNAARKAEVDVEDIVKAEEKLQDLRSMDQEAKAQKLLKATEATKKKELFLLVKKDDCSGLEAALKVLPPELQWETWKDYAGRSMWQCALELKAINVQRYLAPRLGYRMPEETRRSRAETDDEEQDIFDMANKGLIHTVVNQGSNNEAKGASLVEQIEENIPLASGEVVRRDLRRQSKERDEYQVIRERRHSEDGESAEQGGSHGSSPAGEKKQRPVLSEAEIDDWRTKAFKAVVGNDFEAIVTFLDAVDVEIWAPWQNKAGKDLLTLSLERGSKDVYPELAKARGILKEQRREAYEEREPVWVFFRDEVQPRRATVAEETGEEADEILVEFWDDEADAPAQRVSRCSVRKMGG